MKSRRRVDLNVRLWSSYMKHILSVVISLLLLLSHYSAAAGQVTLDQTKSHRDSAVIDSLPPPNDAEIRKIRDAQEWPNPYVIVYADVYELVLHDQKRGSARLTLNELENALLDLPLKRWPLGKVVAIQQSGLRSAGDDSKIASSLQAVKRMLESYKLRIEQWPM
jgi:hypothetical protein